MHILIDNQKSVETTPIWRFGEDGSPWLTLNFDDAHKVLEKWIELDPDRRSYRYAKDESDTTPSRIIIAWVGLGLVMVDVDAHFDGMNEINAYRLDDLAEALHAGALQWGEQIGEDDAPPLPEWAVRT